MVSQTPIIQANGLTKVYGSAAITTRALDNLNLTVRQGEIFGYLGPNGAGKTTTIKLLLDLIRPTSGAAQLFTLDAKENSVEIHKRVGFLPGELNLWKGQSAQHVIQYIGRVRGMDDTRYAAELAERLQLDLRKKVRDYSTGNKRKLGLVIAMMHKPELLILDEPTSGLDPLMQQEFNQMMREVRTEGRTVFLSSHILGEVQAICDRVGILRDGQLKAIETVERLTRVDFRWIEMRFRDAIPQSWAAHLREVEGVTEVTTNGNSLKLRLHNDLDPVLRVVSEGYMQDMRVQEPTLEEIFLTYYDNGQRTANAAAQEEV